MAPFHRSIEIVHMDEHEVDAESDGSGGANNDPERKYQENLQLLAALWDRFRDRDQAKYEFLRTLRARTNWRMIEERREFLQQIDPFVEHWRDEPPPNFHEIFEPHEIEWLLADVAMDHDKYRPEKNFIRFVARSGYRDRLHLNGQGRPLTLLRTTPLHHAAQLQYHFVCADLFAIYDRRDANYRDASGCSHLHVACMAGCAEVVRGFLDPPRPANPNCVWPGTGDLPLHLALAFDRAEVAEALLLAGADPNLAMESEARFTPLHVICVKSEGEGEQQHRSDVELAELLFRCSWRVYRPVEVDARDNLGRTPLQLAVAFSKPELVEALLNRGADLASFVFPARSYLVQHMARDCYNIEVETATRALAVLDHLQVRGYELSRGEAVFVARCLDNTGVFEHFALWQADWYAADEEFARAAREIWIREEEQLSLSELLEMDFEEALERASPRDCARFARETFLAVPEEHALLCLVLIVELAGRRFLRRWALESVAELAHNHLPPICCDAIVRRLDNQDLINVICLMDEACRAQVGSICNVCGQRRPVIQAPMNI